MTNERDHDRPRNLARWASALLVVMGSGPAISSRAAEPEKPTWLGEEMPLPLSVRTPRDLEFKAAVEKQYLIFNLVAAGKWAWDHERYAEAAERWEALLRLPRLDPELAKLVRAWQEEARVRATSSSSAATHAEPTTTPSEVAAVTRPEPRKSVSVTGSVHGGGGNGPGGAVLWLKRTDGPTPSPRPLKRAHMSQSSKTFLPHVLTVTTGTTVYFDNKDAIFHDVFSLTKPNDFDSGLFEGGGSYQKVFRTAGAAQILCNIHASMLAYIVVVDTPWYAQADRDGRFHIRDVPPGSYQLFAWHEASSAVATSSLTVGDNGAAGVVVRITGDVRPANLVPDKYGHPRQRQLGY